MQIDCSGVEQFLAYVDGETPLSEVWNHPGYQVVQQHAALFGRDLTQEDIPRALDGEETPFTRVDDLEENRERIEQLLADVRSTESEWTDEITRNLERITADEDLNSVTLYLGIGYDPGIGLGDGAYVNLNWGPYLDHPRELLYTAIHECSHVVYERVHETVSEVSPEHFQTREGQQFIFDAVFQTEAYATYTPLALRRADGNAGTHDNVISQDYRVLDDEERIQELVTEFDALRERLETEPVSRTELLGALFGDKRLPYRLGCALLDCLEQKEGLDAVREAFYTDSEQFLSEYDWVLDEYRTAG
jgi:hypothetical protein